jgi:dihydrofolate reductase
MKKVIWHTMMSLDGYVAGPNDEMDWIFGHGSAGPIAGQTEETTGAIMMGRHLYGVADELHEETGGIYGGRWKGPVLVLTSHPDDAPDDPRVTFIPGPFEGAVATGIEAAGDGALNLFGPTLGAQAVEHGLLDELIVHIAPVLLGDGKRLYGDGRPRADLERIETTQGEQIVDLRYRVRRR